MTSTKSPDFKAGYAAAYSELRAIVQETAIATRYAFAPADPGRSKRTTAKR